MKTERPAVSAALGPLLERLGHAADAPVEVAGAAGSGRVFFRIGTPPRSHILLVSPPDDAEFSGFIEIARALRAAGLRVPAILGADEDARQAVLEDLGATHLGDRAAAARGDEAALEAVYRPALEALAAWQRRGTEVLRTCPALSRRALERRALRWETGYFARRYAIEARGLPPARLAEPALEAEFEALARRVEAHDRVLIHRDCQSQNLLWRDGAYWFVDFQGARPGSSWYDLASLLWDPYVGLPDALRRRLFEAWRRIAPHPGPSAEAAWESLLDAALQRLCQALGAFAFLSREKGLAWYRQHMAPARRALAAVAAERGGLPALGALLEEIAAREPDDAPVLPRGASPF